MGDVAREAHLVRGDQHRHAVGGELADDLEHLGDELGVERARDLVEQQQPRLHRQRPDDGHALLLSAGEPVGILVALVREAEAVEELVRASVGLRPSQPQRLPRPERDVVEHGHVREEVERLEDDPDPAPHAVDVDAVLGDLVAVQDDPSRRRSARAG